ncbi:hypothetical protein T03_11312 [Trichinella britovi]|uniref:CGG triplet repeat-binding protein 1 n=1 Tax=Trichinella britovi TaxID=45882 RepID=A0A0V1C9R7_TRIBR|nr:hypothetical protein T03_11312 [Trichinella britovi]
MAKVKSKTSKKVIGLVKEYESDILSTDNTLLFCKACGKTINHEKKYFVYQYMQMIKHKSATEKMKTESKQACLLSTFVADSSSKSQFPTDLCMAFIDVGIPLWILENKSLRGGVLEKYTKQHIPTNKDLKEIQSIAEVLKGKSNAQLIGMNIESAVCFKYAPVTSAENFLVPKNPDSSHKWIHFTGEQENKVISSNSWYAKLKMQNDFDG